MYKFHLKSLNDSVRIDLHLKLDVSIIFLGSSAEYFTNFNFITKGEKVYCLVQFYLHACKVYA